MNKILKKSFDGIVYFGIFIISICIGIYIAGTITDYIFNL